MRDSVRDVGELGRAVPETASEARKRSWVINALLSVGIYVLFEALSRWLFPVPDYQNFNRVSYSPAISPTGMENHPKLSHHSFIIASKPDGVDFVHELNLYGFRDREWRAHTRLPRAMFVGDSFVEGFLAGGDETLPAGFEAAAARAGSQVNTLNMGVLGAGAKEYFQIVYDAVPRFRPDDVFVVFYANDFPIPGGQEALGTSSAPVRRTNVLLPRIAQVISHIVQGETVAMRWHSEPFYFFASVPHEANPWTKREKVYSFVEPEIAEAMRNGLFNPYMVDEVNWYRNTLKIPFEIGAALHTLDRYIAESGGKLWIYYIPTRHQITDRYMPYARKFCREDRIVDLTGPEWRLQASRLAEACETAGIPYLDLTPYLESRENAGEQLYWNYDAHFKGSTYLEVGAAIFDHWQETRSAEDRATNSRQKSIHGTRTRS